MSFRRYDRYNDSGVAWLGDVPAHWSVASLKRQFLIYSGSTPKSDEAVFWDGDISWATPADLSATQGVYINGTQRTITASGLDSCGSTLVPSGSIILSTRAPIGSIAIAAHDICTNQGCRALVSRTPNSSLFFYFAIKSAVPELNARGTGTTFLELSARELASFEIPVPQPDEQVAIADFLERETAKIDALIAEQQRLMALLKEKRQAVIAHAVTKGLDPNAPMRDSGVEWLGEVPAHWRVTRLRPLFQFVKRQEQAQLTILSVYREFGVIDKASREDNNNKTPEDLSLYQTVKPGDLVINKMKAWQGSLGISTLSGITSPDYAVFEPTHSERGRFVDYLLRCILLPPVYKSISNGIRPDQWRIEPEKFLGLSVALPPVELQDDIVTFLERELSAHGQLAIEAESAIALLQERRSALISAAVTGKIDVRGVTPVEAEAA